MRFNIVKKGLVLLFILIAFNACEDNTLENGMKPVHWDRDICQRCKMIMSEKKFAVQVVNAKTNKSYMFDDLGCAVLWFIEDEITWFNEANIFIADAMTGKWLNAREAIYIGDTLTPMGYGLSAYSKKTIVENSEHLNFEQAVEKIKQIDHQQKMRRKNNSHIHH
jgi:hypothetical protein